MLLDALQSVESLSADCVDDLDSSVRLIAGVSGTIGTASNQPTIPDGATATIPDGTRAASNQSTINRRLDRQLVEYDEKPALSVYLSAKAFIADIQMNLTAIAPAACLPEVCLSLF